MDNGAHVDPQEESNRLLRPGSTCWRLEPADRAAFIVDAADYFVMAKAAMRNARHSILMLGWDFDPRVRLRPDDPGAELPDAFGAFLEGLVVQRRDLHAHILIWDMALPVSAPRLLTPQRARSWPRSDRIQYRLDDAHPAGACHHQKILVVDDAIAFCGGMDFAGNRWDTPDHADDDPRRRTPEGHPFAPRHDVMIAVDGAAAGALGDLVRARWQRATGERLAPPACGDAWPAELVPDVTGVSIGIVRTEPAWNGRAEIRENEALYRDAIAAARRWIYLESQYLASSMIGEALAGRLKEPDGPDVVVLCPMHSPSYFDRLVMDPVRDRLVQRLRAADRFGRLRVDAPVTVGGAPIVVHSKVAIVDDRLLRIGSANLNNRSFGFDSECDLAIEAMSASPDDPAAMRIRRFLERLLAEHLGTSVEAVGESLARTGRLIPTIESLNPASGRRLVPIDGGEPRGFGSMIAAGHLMDPRGTADAWRPWKRHRPALPALRSGI